MTIANIDYPFHSYWEDVTAYDTISLSSESRNIRNLRVHPLQHGNGSPASLHKKAIEWPNIYTNLYNTMTKKYT